MGEQSNVNRVHPHKFRRTMATAAIDKGMPIGQVQRLLGHEKIDTKAEASAISASEMEFFGQEEFSLPRWHIVYDKHL